jgi:hypothetical protein
MGKLKGQMGKAQARQKAKRERRWKRKGGKPASLKDKKARRRPNRKPLIGHTDRVGTRILDTINAGLR